MRRIVYFIIGSILAAVMSVGFSFIGAFNLVWIAVVVLVLEEMETEAVVFAVISGFLMDVFLHSSIGATSLSILIGLVLFVLAKAVRFGAKTYEKAILVLIVFTVAFLADYSIRGWVGGGTITQIGSEYLLPNIIRHAVGVAAGIGVMRYAGSSHRGKSAVTLK